MYMLAATGVTTAIYLVALVGAVLTHLGAKLLRKGRKDGES